MIKIKKRMEKSKMKIFKDDRVNNDALEDARNNKIPINLNTFDEDTLKSIESFNKKLISFDTIPI